MEPHQGGLEGLPRVEGGDALLIFARVPALGRVKSRLAAAVGAEHALRFYKACCAKVLPRLVRSTTDQGVTCFLFWAHHSPSHHIPSPSASTSPHSLEGESTDPPASAEAAAGLVEAREWMRELGLDSCQRFHLVPQDESPDLGVKLLRGVSSVLDLGFSRAVVVGTDIPDLSPYEVSLAFRQLESHQAVFGPATDGGYYLVGIRGPKVPPSLFLGIQWSTDSVFAESLEAAKSAKLDVAPREALPVLLDIDTADDLCQWYKTAIKREKPQGKKEPHKDEQGKQEEPSIASSSSHDLSLASNHGSTKPEPSFQRNVVDLSPFLEVVRAVLAERELLRELLSETGYTLS